MFRGKPHVIVHIGRRSIISWRSGISLIIVHVLSWILIIARIGLPHHRVGSACSPWRKMLFLASSISTLVTKIVMLVVSVILVYHLPEKVHSSPFLFWSRVGKCLNHQTKAALVLLRSF